MTPFARQIEPALSPPLDLSVLVEYPNSYYCRKISRDVKKNQTRNCLVLPRCCVPALSVEGGEVVEVSDPHQHREADA